MSDDTLKIKRKLSTLTSSLDDLETSLTPLLSQSLPDLVIGLDTIQQAKLQVVIPYLVYDLVFVYLKTRGLDPKTHPVIAELDRVRQYFDKIKDAEDPAKRQLVIDKAAATRFIKNAIAQANDTILTNASDSGPSTTTTATTHPHFGDDSRNGKNANDKAHDAHVPAKKTEKMLEHEKYHEALREEAQLASDEDGEPLDIIDNDDGDEEEERDKGKANAAVASPIPIPDVPPPSTADSRKRGRPPIDPFAGYGDDPDTTPARSSAASAETDSAPSTSRPARKNRKARAENSSSDVLSGGGIGTIPPKEHQTRSKKRQRNDPEKK